MDDPIISNSNCTPPREWEVVSTGVPSMDQLIQEDRTTARSHTRLNKGVAFTHLRSAVASAPVDVDLQRMIEILAIYLTAVGAGIRTDWVGTLAEVFEMRFGTNPFQEYCPEFSALIKRFRYG